MDFSQELFDGKTLGSLFKDIYSNHKNTKKQIGDVVGVLKEMVNEPGEAVMIIPLVKDLMETSVKNDDALVKMANAAIKASDKGAAAGDDSGELLTDKEREQLFAEIKGIQIPQLPSNSLVN